MCLNNLGCVFHISNLLKTSRLKFNQYPKELKAYPHDASLFVVALIKLCLDKTAALRHDVNTIFLLGSPTQTSVTKNIVKVGIRCFT